MPNPSKNKIPKAKVKKPSSCFEILYKPSATKVRENNPGNKKPRYIISILFWSTLFILYQLNQNVSCRFGRANFFYQSFLH